MVNRLHVAGIALIAAVVTVLALLRGRHAIGRAKLRRPCSAAAAERDGLSPQGFPKGSVLADFELPNLQGRTRTLTEWQSQRVLLMFVDPEREPSRELVYGLAEALRGQEEIKAAPLVISTGSVETNLQLFSDFPLPGQVLIQDHVEVAWIHRVRVTPAGYLINEVGITETPLVTGADALLSLIGDTGSLDRRAAGIPPLGAATSLPEPRRVRDNALLEGSKAPEFCLPRIDGGELCLRDYRGRRTLLVFLEPSCIPSNSLLPALQALHTKNPGVQVVAISRGTANLNMKHASQTGVSFPIGLQDDREVAHAFGVVAVPAAVLIDEEGLVASTIAIGKDHIVNLGTAGKPVAPPVHRVIRGDTERACNPGGVSTQGAGTARKSPVEPLVSVILTTRDRPQFLQAALACYCHQTYGHRELIVVDDGDVFPVDESTISAAGGRLLTVPAGTPLGTKLNRGVEIARGELCQKMDDDDWYSPRFLEEMVGALRKDTRSSCQPEFAFVSPFLFFDVARWEVRRSVDRNLPGATLMFGREEWRRQPFRGVRRDEDVWFFLDQVWLGAQPVIVDALETFIAVRHGGTTRERGHTWVRQSDGQELESYLLDRPLHEKAPEELLPAWALAFYSDLRQQLTTPTGSAALASYRSKISSR